MTRRALPPLLVALAALARTHPLHAQEPVRSVSFAWVRGDGADACPAHTRVMSAVRAQLGRDPFSITASVAAEALVERANDRWHARLRLRDETGAVRFERDLTDASPTCDTLADAVALSLALSLAPATPTPAQHDGEIAPPAIPPPLTAPVAPTPPPPRDLAHVELAAEAILGPLPRLAWGTSLRLDVPLTTRWRVFGAVGFEPEIRTGDLGEWAFGMTRATAGVCAHPTLPWRFDFGACAGLSAGLIHAVTFGRAALEPGNYPWIAASLDARATIPVVANVSLTLSLGALMAFVLNDFVAREGALDRPVFRQNVLNGSASAGLSLAF